MVASELTAFLRGLGARLPDAPTALRLGATARAGVIAVWAVGLALALVAARPVPPPACPRPAPGTA